MEHDPSIDYLPASKVISHSNVIFSEGIAVTIWVDMDFTNKDMEFVQSLPTNQPTNQLTNQPTIFIGYYKYYIHYIHISSYANDAKMVDFGHLQCQKRRHLQRTRGDTYGCHRRR